MLPGGGVALLYATKILDFLEFENEEQRIGKEILKKAIRRPIEVLMENGGLNGRFIVETLLEKAKDNYTGFDLNSRINAFTLVCHDVLESYVNMMEKGIMDGFLIVRTALEDAISCGTMVLTTEVVVANEKIYIRNLFFFYNFLYKFHSETIELLSQRSILIY